MKQFEEHYFKSIYSGLSGFAKNYLVHSEAEAKLLKFKVDFQYCKHCLWKVGK